MSEAEKLIGDLISCTNEVENIKVKSWKELYLELDQEIKNYEYPIYKSLSVDYKEERKTEVKEKKNI